MLCAYRQLPITVYPFMVCIQHFIMRSNCLFIFTLNDEIYIQCYCRYLEGDLCVSNFTCTRAWTSFWTFHVSSAWGGDSTHKHLKHFFLYFSQLRNQSAEQTLTNASLYANMSSPRPLCVTWPECFHASISLLPLFLQAMFWEREGWYLLVHFIAHWWHHLFCWGRSRFVFKSDTKPPRCSGFHWNVHTYSYSLWLLTFCFCFLK